MERVKPEKMPSFQIENRILIIKIPSWLIWLGPIDKKLINFCEENKEDYDSILIDVRENHGGNSVYALNFAGIFFNKTLYYGHILKKNQKTGRLNKKALKVRPHKKILSDKPIAILISGKCFSSNEHFLVPFKVSKRATLIGGKTMSGSANPISDVIELAGNKFTIRIPTWRFFLLGEESPIERTKIKPDIVYNGKDIEEFAKNYLLNHTYENNRTIKK